jgi:TolB-like protein/DNA-binding winged helix-turn-helix (wHTH) protein/Tfp pilus assembly protein PilF
LREEKDIETNADGATPRRQDGPDSGMRWRFGEAELLEGQPRLIVRGNAQDLDHSSHEVLRCLLEHSGRVVNKDRLLQVGWPGRVVSENSLTKAIGRLRQALEDPDGELLCTVHGYGYRLASIAMRVPAEARTAPAAAVVAPAIVAAAPETRPRVTPRSLYMPTLALLLAVAVAALAWRPWLQPSPPATARAPAAPVAAEPASIAVLPFADLSPAGDQRYFGDGLAEELIDRLAKIPTFRVAGRTSSFSFREAREDVSEIGRQLGVRHVLEGSVRKSGERMRITVQLIDTRTGFHAWSETYDRAPGDLFVVQDQIATEVAGVLETKLLPEQREMLRQRKTGNVEAYDLFLRARELRGRGTPDDNRRAVAALERAVRLDPRFARAYAELADMLGGDADYADTPAAVAAGKDRALEMLDKAIELDPSQADSLIARADFLYSTRWDWAGAQRDLDAAARLEPGDDLQRMIKQARLYAALGRLPEALALERRMTVLSPDAPEPWTMMGFHAIAAGRLAEGRAALARALKLRPDEAHANFHMGTSWLLEGKPDEALRAFDHGGGGFRLAGMAMALHSAGRSQEADGLLATLAARYAHSGAYQVAQVYAWRGDTERAFAWLERAEEQRDAGLIYLKFDPLLRKLHGDPRYAAWLKRMRLSA